MKTTFPKVFKITFWRELIIIGMVLSLATFMGVVIAIKGDNWGFKIIIMSVLGIIGAWLAWKKPAYLFLVAIFASSTFPAIVFGQWLSISGRAGASNFRLEYVLFVVLVFLFLGQLKTNIRTPLDLPVFAFLVIQCVSIVIARMSGYAIAVGPAIRLIEGYAFFFLASRLTSSKEIPVLMKWVLGMALVAGGVIVVTSITGNQFLYANLFADSPENIQKDLFYTTFYSNYQSARIGYTISDNLLLIALAFSLAMVFLNKRLRLSYYVLILTISMRALVSGQRFWVVWLIATFIVTFAFVAYIQKKEWPRTVLRVLIPIILVILILFGLFYSQEAWRAKINVLFERSVNTVEYVQSTAQTSGIILAWGQLLDDPMGFLLGFSPFRRDIRVDINFGMLVTIYRYGVIGLVAMLGILAVSFYQGLKLLKLPFLQPEEQALICAVLTFIVIQFGNGFIRGTAFNENGVALIVFSTMLGWIQVIAVKAQKKLINENAG